MSETATLCHELAETLLYTSKEKAINRVLQEASLVLNKHAVKVIKKGKTLYICNALGYGRPMTLKERLAYFILGDTSLTV